MGRPVLQSAAIPDPPEFKWMDWDYFKPSTPRGNKITFQTANRFTMWLCSFGGAVPINNVAASSSLYAIGARLIFRLDGRTQLKIPVVPICYYDVAGESTHIGWRNFEWGQRKVSFNRHTAAPNTWTTSNLWYWFAPEASTRDSLNVTNGNSQDNRANTDMGMRVSVATSMSAGYYGLWRSKMTPMTLNVLADELAIEIDPIASYCTTAPSLDTFVTAMGHCFGVGLFMIERV